jgi:hypothetical protein|tara:strand:- start:3045 stop:3149 length:105 start_codon:yes stop_codon:yes gene_type:complete
MAKKRKTGSKGCTIVKGYKTKKGKSVKGYTRKKK